ncbi:MAG: NUDIX hydrolase N-terminal domain-containing protein [Fastidiosipilaceae bacterium]
MDKKINESDRWLDWAVELQSLAQAGLTYTGNDFERERFQRIRDIAAEIITYKSEISPKVVKNIFCNETGYQTPKLETRSAIFSGDKILLVRERSGKWALPGGWVDVNLSIKENAIKEVKEEAGLDVTADRIIAMLDSSKHNLPYFAHRICKVFVLCTSYGGSFQKNIETTGSHYFGINELPELAIGKNTPEQIRMCFQAVQSAEWEIIFD